MNKLFFKILIITIIIICFNIPCFYTQIQSESINLNVKEISLTKWDAQEGILYRQGPGANLGATSFEILDDKQIAFLCNSSNEIVIIDQASGKVIKRLDVAWGPHSFVYDKGFFYVLSGLKLFKYDIYGKKINEFTAPSSFNYIEQVARYNNSTYLLEGGKSIKIESNGYAIEPKEYDGYITNSGWFLSTRCEGNKYFVSVLIGNDKILKKAFETNSKLAGVYIVGATKKRIVLDVQKSISECPITVERELVVISLHEKDIGEIIAKIRIPNCYYVFQDKEFLLNKNGNIFHMLTSPEGVYVFSLRETKSKIFNNYPQTILQTKYHYNEHLMKVD